MRKSLFHMAVWGILASVLGLVINLVHPHGIDYIKKAPPPDVDEEAVRPDEIGIQSAYELYASGEYLFVDSRSRVQFEKGRIEGAVSLPWDDFEKYYEEVTPILDSYPGIVVYCDGATCDTSHALGRKLLRDGYPQVLVFFDGWEMWEEMEFPTEEGA